MIGLNLVYGVAGSVFALFAVLALADAPRRIANAAFYALLSVSFFAGDLLGDFGNGLLVIALTAIAASGRFRARPREASPERPRGNALFAAALIIPATALVGTLLFKQVPALVDARQATLVALALGVLLALGIGYAWLRPGLATPFREGRRLMDDVGWAAVLPQMLASLGAVFAIAGVGDVVGGLVGGAIPEGSLLGAVAAYAVGMALFTVVMGNAFAAFPVMAAAVGVPILMRQFGGDPAPVAAIGMLAGFCGTLMTPMAANFNLVPAALLELKDRNGVVKAQVPTALPLLLFNLALLWWVLS
ncbi:5-oxoproline transporter, DUF979 family subunit [Sphingomonas lenta]|uniref:DUF979 domain-containing protein n=1 Tax=Sphingomonas lenta TaxID=1141887 RepID=A0A2A2SBN8_9SPHN|nr:DUF979 family protein [Sphingomonas lenta]PAX06633.1 hypothetical protein CKY28_15955 [Sphingomonas lenta]